MQPVEPSAAAKLLAKAEKFGGVEHLLAKMEELEQLAAQYKLDPKDVLDSAVALVRRALQERASLRSAAPPTATNPKALLDSAVNLVGRALQERARLSSAAPPTATDSTDAQC